MVIKAKQIVVLVSSCLFLLMYCCGKTKTKELVNNFKNQGITYFDTAVNNLILRDTASVVNKTGDISKYIINDFNKWESVVLTNKYRNEFLIMVREYGGFVNQYCYYYLTKNVDKTDITKMQILEDSIFVTNRGGFLNMKEDVFLKKYYNVKFKRRVLNNQIIYSFENDVEMYNCKYIFEDKRLIEIDFGYQW